MLNNYKFVTKINVLTTFVLFNIHKHFIHKHFLHHIKSDISIVPKARNTVLYNHLKKSIMSSMLSQKRDICCRKCFIKRSRDLKFK